PHGRRSGVVHVTTDSTEEAYARARLLCTLLSRQGELDLDAVEDRDLAATFPESPRRAYDVHPVVEDLLDDGSPEAALELFPRWAPNIVTTLGRIGGRTVGVVANNPMRL